MYSVIILDHSFLFIEIRAGLLPRPSIQERVSVNVMNAFTTRSSNQDHIFSPYDLEQGWATFFVNGPILTFILQRASEQGRVVKADKLHLHMNYLQY